MYDKYSGKDASYVYYTKYRNRFLAHSVEFPRASDKIREEGKGLPAPICRLTVVGKGPKSAIYL